eukprot:3637343-Rhodomonas_salina.1
MKISSCASLSSFTLRFEPRKFAALILFCAVILVGVGVASPEHRPPHGEPPQSSGGTRRRFPPWQERALQLAAGAPPTAAD